MGLVRPRRTKTQGVIMVEQGADGRSAATQDVVRVESGLLAGTVGADPQVRVFKGIPFAAPPVGERRLDGGALCRRKAPGDGLVPRRRLC